MQFLIISLMTLLLLLQCARTTHVEEKRRELKLVHVVMRHGIRAPVSTYPKDPFINQYFEPYGWGQLTSAGIKESYQFGEFLRTRYDKLIGNQYLAEEYHSQSTGVDRALGTLMAVNAGLWKPNEAQTWNNGLRWLPIPVHSEPLNDDMLLLVRKDCPQYNIELSRVEELSEVRERLEMYKETFAYVQEATGQEIKNFNDIEDVYTTLMAEEAFGLTLPAWTYGYFPEKMKEPASFNFVLKAYNEKLQRLKGGVLLKKLLKDWKAKSLDKLTQKMFLYGGHDTTISNLMSALKIFEPQVPGYGMAVIFELSYDLTDNIYGLEIFIKNPGKETIRMKLPDCEFFCPLEKVILLSKNVVPIDWVGECTLDDPNYTPPPQRGP